MFRIGQGFDIHRFGPPPPEGVIWLGGVAVSSDKSLIAHSDGDVLLHALCDALLGAVGLGDIGTHFADTNPAFENTSSSWFVINVMEKVRQKGFEPVNIDVTIMAQAPKIGPYRTAMNAKIAGLVGIDASLVNVKATTTEGLGFVGRQEGIAAQACVLLTSNQSN